MRMRYVTNLRWPNDNRTKFFSSWSSFIMLIMLGRGSFEALIFLKNIFLLKKLCTAVSSIHYYANSRDLARAAI